MFAARPRPAYSPADGSQCSAAFNLCHPILAGLTFWVAENKWGPILNAAFWNQPECWMGDKNINVQMYVHYLPLICHSGHLFNDNMQARKRFLFCFHTLCNYDWVWHQHAVMKMNSDLHTLSGLIWSISHIQQMRQTEKIYLKSQQFYLHLEAGAFLNVPEDRRRVMPERCSFQRKNARFFMLNMYKWRNGLKDAVKSFVRHLVQLFLQ